MLLSMFLANALPNWNMFKLMPPSFDLISVLLSVPSEGHIRNSSAFYTSSPHFVGQGLSQAEWTRDKWSEFGIPSVRIASYDVDVPKPTEEQRVALVRGSEVLFEATLNDSNGGFVPAFYSFSTNGNMTASYVFANVGSNEDYDDLAKNNVSVLGKIAILKSADASVYLQLLHLETSREVQIKTAQDRGLAGVLMYPDPQNDGVVTESNGYAPYPEGPARPPGMIERGGIGPYVSYREGLLPTIPCLPISYGDAIPILSTLNGHGPLASELGSRWSGGGLATHNVHYNVGPSPPDVSLVLKTEAYIHTGQAHNVIGTIPGVLTDEVIILGNHRDSWGRGAGDPNSGSAALNEVVRSFGIALQRGWRPHRTLIFASWEGEEIGQVGSRPWIEEHFQWLNATVVSYLNVVVAGAGRNFHIKASPLLYQTALSSMALVTSPNQTVGDQSVLDVWNRTGAGTMGVAGGGDAIQFQGLLCTSTVDFGFSQGLGDSAFPYHSGFDTFEWMSRFGDPGWQYHLTSAKLWLAMAAHLSEELLLDMQATDYARALENWVGNLFVNQSWSQWCDPTRLHSAVARLSDAANRFDSCVALLKDQKQPRWSFWSSKKSQSAIAEVNQRLVKLERVFYYEEGLDNRPSLHHVLFDAGPWHTDKPPLPGLRRSLEAGNWTNAKRWRDIIANKIDEAADLLEHNRACG